MKTPDRTILPASMKQAVTLWLVAIAAGVFETLLVVVNVLAGDGSLANGEDLNAGVAVRLTIFVAMTLVTLQVRLGKNWARWTIGLLLGVFGLLSLVIQPVSWLMEGHTVSESFTNLNLSSATFMLSRAVHMAAVVTATVLMFVSTSNIFSGHNVLDGNSMATMRCSFVMRKGTKMSPLYERRD